MSFGDKPNWKRRALDAEEQRDRAIACLDHYTVSPEDAAAMREFVMTGKRDGLTAEQAWAEAVIERWAGAAPEPMLTEGESVWNIH